MIPKLCKSLIKGTNFGQDNALILREIQYFPKFIALAVIFPLLAALFEGFGIGFLLGFLQNLVSADGVPFKTGIDWFDVWVLGTNEPDLNRLYRVSTLILLSTWLRALCNYFTEVYMKLAQFMLINRLYKRVFEQLQSLSLAFFSQVKSGEIINTLTTEVNQLQLAIGAFSFIVTKGSTLIVYTLIAIWISWPLTISGVLLFGLTTVCLTNLNRRVREASFSVSRTRGKFMALASEFINGIRTVQVFSTQDFERKRFYQASDETVDAGVSVARKSALVRPLAEALASTILIGIIIMGMVIFVANGELDVASLLTFLFILFRLVPAIQELNGCVADIGKFQGSIHNIQELLRTDNKPYILSGKNQFKGLRKSIEFVSVYFGYEVDRLVLRDINLTIKKGETIALVGSSGAGKTTLADLIPRFYDPIKGKILIDGIDAREFEVTSLRHRMAIVSQDTFIFNASVEENIAYGSEGASKEEIIHVARLANALEFIEKMPEGFRTQLGDRGVRLSGGQRQRIAIARALLRDPEILILDEATSALDSASERLIQQSIDKLAVGRTVIAIAHRLSTIKNAQKIIVLEEGRVVEHGTYNELLKAHGALWRYHSIQNGNGSPIETLTD